ncbi:MAG TPA: hypothetical protein VJJ70_00150 [Anaerolineales bacterium]|nr:hypothetical protein [Anaerolineales bacterium]
MFYPQTLVRRVESEAVTPLPLAAVGLVALHGTALMPVALATIARLAAQRGPVWVVDGGNCFDALWVARFLASSTPGGPAPHLALARIHVSRAFTCHQLTERLLTLPASASPLVILGLLDTFYDENVPYEETRRLLNCIWPVVRDRSRAAPVLVTLAAPRETEAAGRRAFFETFLRLADHTLGPAPEAQRPSPQLPLWHVPAAGVPAAREARALLRAPGAAAG